MRFRHCIWLLLAAAHLALVICGACDGLPDGRGEPIARPLLWYAQMSGADSKYSFYAPEVGDNYRARFTLQDSQGCAWSASFEEADSPEARLRLSGIAAAGFANGAAAESPERRKRLVRSWAATMFSRHPSSVSLTVVVEEYEIPTMAQYREGRRPRWNVVYQAQAQRNSSPPQERGVP